MPQRNQTQNRRDEHGWQRQNTAMQRMPSDKHRSAVAEAPAKKEAEISPLLLLARRIRAEQGAEGLKAFLTAMAPFAAPYELKNIATNFGVEYESIRRSETMEEDNEAKRTAQSTKKQGFDPNMIRMLQMMNGANNRGGEQNSGGMNTGAANMGGMMQLLNLMPMLSGMMRGGDQSKKL